VGRIYEEIKVNGVSVKAQIDTGTDMTYIDEDLLRAMGLVSTQKMNASLAGRMDIPINLYIAEIKIRGCSIFQVVGGGKTNIIGNDILQKFNAVVDEEKGTVEFKRCPLQNKVGNIHEKKCPSFEIE